LVAEAQPAGFRESDPQLEGFAHPSEREFARILNFYGITWRYEPRSFPLRWKDDQVLEMFTPDFYLPDLDLYVEMTTLRQRLVTRKNRKLRLLRELYPEIAIVLLYKRDYFQLIAKHGYGASDVPPPELESVLRHAERILYTDAQVQLCVRRLGEEITRDYAGRAPILVGVLKGVTFFMADLARAIELPVSLDFMAVTHYKHARENGALRIVKDLDLDVSGRDVILIEDIVDTGFSLRYVLAHLQARNPASVKVCTLLDKRARRLADVPLHYVGFQIGNEFVVGYGLDFHQCYRNLRFLAAIRPESLTSPTH
jgi:hypoxanthine phosphoribosyltransferase